MKEYTFPGLVGGIHRYDKYPSRYVSPRRVDIWLPSGYQGGSSERYAVLYMMDGQNLFNPEYSKYSHVDWGIDETLTRLMKEEKVRKTIVVGIWSNRQRVIEYMPQKAADLFKQSGHLTNLRWLKKGFTLSDQFLKFIVEELKPMVDATYRTLPDKENTVIMGSSMGGLISLYALCEYPQVFGGAGCLSTHFPIADGMVLDYMKLHLPKPGSNRLYFDFGTGTLDKDYELFQDGADEILRVAGYRQGVDWMTMKFEGHNHSEVSWRERVHLPLEFLLPVTKEKDGNQ